MRKDQCDARVVADVAKAAVVKGQDLQRAGKCRGLLQEGMSAWAESFTCDRLRPL